MTGTNDGPLGNAPPTGRSIDIPGADYWTVIDGAVFEVREYFGAGLMRRQLQGEA